MSWVTQKRTLLRWCMLGASLLFLITPLQTWADDSSPPPQPDVLITELQTTDVLASQEFIELFNNTTHDIDFADTAHQGKDIWKLQFFSSTKVTVAGFNWNPKTAGITTVNLVASDPTQPVVIAAQSYFVVSTAVGGSPYAPGGVVPDFTYASGHMADAGGGVQLVDVVGANSTASFTIHDHVGWFTPTATLPLPSGFYLTPPAQGSLQRTPASDGSYSDGSGNLQPFVGSPDISPDDAWTPPPDPDPTPPDGSGTTTPPADSGDPTDPGTQPDPGADPTSGGDTTTPPADPDFNLLPPQITELLPNPAPPATDAADEFIELYNPNAAPFDLKSYTLETGTTTLHDFTFTDDLMIPANSYEAFYSADTNLSLSNTGGGAKFLDPTGNTLSTTATYDTAKDGQAWALASDNTWQWTTTPTPNAANVITQPIVAAAAPKTPAAPKPKPKTTTVKAVKGTTTTKTAKPKAAKAPKKAAATTTTANFSDTANVTTPIHPAVLALVGGLALLYGLYEYRTDLGNKLYQLRRYRSARRETRGKL